MDAYEKLIKTMRDEASKGVDMPSYGMAVMTGADSLSYNGLELEVDDIIIPDHLAIKWATEVDIEVDDDVSSPNEGHHRHTWTDKTTYTKPLEEGDIVFGFMITEDDDQKFLIMCRIGGE